MNLIALEKEESESGKGGRDFFTVTDILQNQKSQWTFDFKAVTQELLEKKKCTAMSPASVLLPLG